MSNEMRFSLVRTKYKDQTLHGIITGDPAAPLALHVHGTWGNFYANDFIAKTAESYLRVGYRFAAVNFPGHDQTAVNERFEDFPPALNSWLVTLGASDGVILQGHSLGALKVLYLNSSNAKVVRRVRALVLLAAFDVVGFYVRESGMPASQLRQEAAALARTRGDASRVPVAWSPYWDLSVGTLLAATDQGGLWDQFPSGRGSLGALGLETLPPTFFAIGSSDFAAVPGVPEVMGLAESAPNVSGHYLVPDSPHNFAGRETELSESIASWLSKLD